jgi:hypothetical protein
VPDVIESRPSPLTATPFRVAIAMSLLAHAALIVQLPNIKLPRFELPDLQETESRLTVRLAPPFSAPRERAAPPPPPPPAQRARPKPTPPVIALDKPAPSTPPAAAPPVTSGDLLAYIDARRLTRGDAPERQEAPASNRPAEDERSRANRVATANLATQRQLSFGYDPTRSGGVFTVDRLTSDYAEFTFVGWNQDARRRTKQLIEVRKGNNSDIRLAVVREMIAIIRRYEPVEFTWDSQRLNRVVTLSSRARDNAGLEEFMLKEFF